MDTTTRSTDLISAARSRPDTPTTTREEVETGRLARGLNDLRARMRPGCEAAPWVIAEIDRLMEEYRVSVGRGDDE